MQKTVSTKIQATLLVTIVTLSIVSGTAIWLLTRVEDPQWVWGDVILDKPLVGATIKVFDAAGNQLYEEKNATYVTGEFLLSFQTVPKDFLITAEEGTLNNESFSGKVVRQVQNYNETDYYRLNAITTLLANYQAKNPEVPQDQVEKKIEAFLQIPSDQTLAYVIDNIDDDILVFDNSKFLNEANSAGGFDIFISQLTSEVEAGRQHPMGTLLFGDPGLSPGDLASFVGKGAANGMASYVGVQALGWVFSALSDKNSNQQMLEGTSQQLTRIQRSLNDIESMQEHTLNRINELAGAVAEMYRGLRWESEVRALQARSGTIVSSATEPIVKIKTTFDFLQRYSKLNPAKVDAEVKGMLNGAIDQILSPLSGMEPNLNTIDKSLVGILGEKGLLEVWSTLVALGAKKETLNALYGAFESRFDYLLTLELSAIVVMMDAYHGKHGTDTRVAVEFWQNWKAKLTKQIDLFLRFSEKIVASRVDTITGTEFNKLAYSPPLTPNQTYQEPYILQEAYRYSQKMLSSLEGGGNATQGYVTVTILNYPDVTKKLPANISLQLQEVKSKNNYSATFQERRDNTTVADKDFKTVPFELAYYKFTVPYGTYRIRNINGSYPNLLSPEDYSLSSTVDSSSIYAAQAAIAFTETKKSSTEFPKAYSGPWYTAQWPKAVSVDGAGTVYLLDSATITKYDSRGNIIDGWGKNKILLPAGLTVDKSGNVYVLETRTEDGTVFSSFIKKFDSNGNFKTSWGTYGSGIGDIRNPVAIAIDGAGYVYVTDRGLSNVKKYETNGKFVIQWGTSGTGEGQFIEPAGIAIDGNNNVYVADRNRIQKFDSNGRFLAQWGNFNQTGSLAIDTVGGYIYVTDLKARCLQKFDLNGGFISKISIGPMTTVGFSEELAVDSNTGTLYLYNFAKGLLQAWPSIIVVSRNW